MFGPGVNSAMVGHAVTVFPEECCGLIHKGVYVPLRNVSSDPRNSFQLPDRALLDYGPVQAIIHSHCGPGHPKYPSEADLASQKFTRIPVYGLVWTPGTIQGSLIVWFGENISGTHNSPTRRAQR